jgi:hypothetical protein
VPYQLTGGQDVQRIGKVLPWYCVNESLTR